LKMKKKTDVFDATEAHGRRTIEIQRGSNLICRPCE